MIKNKLALLLLSAFFVSACGPESRQPPRPVGSSSSSSPSSGAGSSSSFSASSLSPSSNSSIGSASSSSSTVPAEPKPEPLNAQCLATEFKQPAEIGLERLVDDGSFQQPTGLVFLPGNDQIMYVTQQNGTIWRLVNEGGRVDVKPFVNLADYYNIVGPAGGCYECGLLSMAFHPDFAENGYIYLSFTEEDGFDAPLQSHIARFRTYDGGLTLAVDEAGVPIREAIYQVQQPSSSHNNGQVRFGPDGFLYVSFGDGGPAEDPENKSQSLDNPFGSILRLTDEGDPAPGNKAVGGLPEIYAYGLRNPWHWSFDRETGDIWVGDVGQAKVEEINRIVNGGNYGWPCYEGLEPRDQCSVEGDHIEPVWEYSHVEGQSVTGGYVYRGTELASLAGVYLFGDFGSGLIWGLFHKDDGSYERVRLLASGKQISAFAEDSKGELYLVDHTGGSIHHIGPPPITEDLPPLPELLSATGCVSKEDAKQPSDKLIAYDINEPFWSDNAQKERFLSLPEGSTIGIAADGDFQLPVGTILVKNFRLQDRLIETRLLLHQDNTGWSGFSYRWNEEQTDAVLLSGSEDVAYGDQIWHYPSSAECSQCHTAAAGFSLGLEARQLNRKVTSAAGTELNQLDMFEQLNLFAYPLSAHVRQMQLPSSRDATVPAAERARSYLHSNCSHCHRPGGTSQSTMDWRFDTDLLFARACDRVPLQGDLDVADARLLAPGNPSGSILWHRLQSNGEYRMPPLGSNVVDTESAALIHDWIGSIESCDNTVLGPIGTGYTAKNRLTGSYLAVVNGALQSVDALPDADASQWVVEPAEEFYRLQSRETPEHYLHVQELAADVGEIRPEWWSAQWEILKHGDYVTIRNRWQASSYIYQDEASGEVLAGPVDPGLPQAQWQFEPVE